MTTETQIKEIQMSKAIDPRLFSTKEVNGYQPLFLGEESGLFDSINKPYPAIFELYMKLKVMDWSHTDFPFRICNQQFKSCSKTDYDKMIKTIAFQWEADSLAARHIYPIVAPFLSNYELQTTWSRITENECVTGDHEVLTPLGWKRIDEITLKDEVAQWDYNSNAVSYVNPTMVFMKHYKGTMYKFIDNTNKFISQITTPNHRMPVVYSEDHVGDKPEFVLASDVEYGKTNGAPYTNSFDDVVSIINGSNIEKSTIEFDGMVYCISVPTSYFLVRHDGAISVTGNCLHSLTYSEIVRSSFDDPSQVKKEILAVKESQNRMSHIAKLFEDAYYISHRLALGQINKDDPQVYRAIFMFVVALYCLERGQFPSSFAVSFAYGMKGMFMPIAHAIQKIQADEFQIHQVVDRTVLEIEMSTQRGRDFFESAKQEIEHVIHEVLTAELESNKFVFADGQPAAGFLYREQLDDFARLNFSPIFKTFRMDDPFKELKNPLPQELLKWFNLNEWQISPQEQRGGNYLRCFVTRDADAVEGFDLGKKQLPFMSAV